jgi:hypothetical protein
VVLDKFDSLFGTPDFKEMKNGTVRKNYGAYWTLKV